MGTTPGPVSYNQQETVIELVLRRLDSFEHRLDNLTSRLRSVNRRIVGEVPPKVADSAPVPTPDTVAAQLWEMLSRLDSLESALHEEISEIERFV